MTTADQWAKTWRSIAANTFFYVPKPGEPDHDYKLEIWIVIAHGGAQRYEVECPEETLHIGPEECITFNIENAAGYQCWVFPIESLAGMVVTGTRIEPEPEPTKQAGGSEGS